MLVCNTCNEEKEKTSFYKNSKRYYPYCKACAKQKYAKIHYENNKGKYKYTATQRRKQKQVEWIEFKSKFVCTFCSENRHWCLDFHHLDKTKKEDELPRLFYNASQLDFEKELKKVIPLCRNCHADIHYQERISVAQLAEQ